MAMRRPRHDRGAVFDALLPLPILWAFAHVFVGIVTGKAAVAIEEAQSKKAKGGYP
jgi:hypothetical protein